MRPGRGRLGERDDLDARLEALRSSRSPRRRRRSSSVGPAVLGLMLIVGILGVIYLIYSTATDAGEVSRSPVKVNVVSGDTLSIVAEKLDRAGVIESAMLFKAEARLGGHGTKIKPGEYEFRPGGDTGEILAALTAGKPAPTFTVTVPEGLTVEQTARQVAARSRVSAREFQRAADGTDYGYAFLEDPAIKTTEGFLFPKKYEFEVGASARQMVDRMLEQYLIETQNMDFKTAERRLNLSEYELLTVASMIERESANAGERPRIASVIYNRMRRDMPLQIDATIQYALGEPKEALSEGDLRVRSPYNTYQRAGLPPGPIASPSRESIEAALDPAKTNYLYYVLDSSGERHFFTSSYKEFLRAKAAAGH